MELSFIKNSWVRVISVVRQLLDPANFNYILNRQIRADAYEGPKYQAGLKLDQFGVDFRKCVQSMNLRATSTAMDGVF